MLAWKYNGVQGIAPGRDDPAIGLLPILPLEVLLEFEKELASSMVRVRTQQARTASLEQDVSDHGAAELSSELVTIENLAIAVGRERMIRQTSVRES